MHVSEFTGDSAMRIRKLFSTPNGNQALASAIDFLKNHENDIIDRRLRQVLVIIKNHAEDFDAACQINIEWIGDDTVERLKSFHTFGDDTDKEITDLAASIFRFITEFDLSVRNELSMEFRAFLDAVIEDIDRFAGTARDQIEFARNNMAAAIVKRIVNTEEFGSLRNIESIATTVESKIDGWNDSLDASEKKATQLSEVLESHTRTFNFVGLHQGFSDLADKIEIELKTAQRQMFAFGVFLLVPSLLELYLISSKKLDIDNFSVPILIATFASVVALTLIILYFFRIALRKADSSRIQLTQIRLRMSLCRFIQSYADYSAEIKSKNGIALEKFESLIFSGIVSSEEKLPSTFDGIDQLAALAKSVRGGS